MSRISGPAAKLKPLFDRHYEALAYLFFGFLAFVLNTLCYWGLSRLFGGTDPSAMHVMAANTIAFFATVMFAYFTNSLFVFRSGVSRSTFLGFWGMRIGTVFIDNGGMWLLLLVSCPDIAAKGIVNAVIIVLNYLFSKFIIFKKREGGR